MSVRKSLWASINTVHVSVNSQIIFCLRFQGINFNADRLIVNTLKSHCMLDYAKAEGKQDLLAENLFRAYFEEAKDINSLDILAKVAVDTGLNLDAMEK